MLDLDAIKQRYPFSLRHAAETGTIYRDVNALIAEVERLRAENATLRSSNPFARLDAEERAAGLTPLSDLYADTLSP
jgi:hypothetical protein